MWNLYDLYIPTGATNYASWTASNPMQACKIAWPAVRAVTCCGYSILNNFSGFTVLGLLYYGCNTVSINFCFAAKQGSTTWRSLLVGALGKAQMLSVGSSRFPTLPLWTKGSTQSSWSKHGHFVIAAAKLCICFTVETVWNTEYMFDLFNSSHWGMQKLQSRTAWLEPSFNRWRWSSIFRRGSAMRSCRQSACGVGMAALTWLSCMFCLLDSHVCYLVQRFWMFYRSLCLGVFHWGCPYSDDALSSKKLLPGFNFRSAKTQKSSPWYQRLKSTEASTLLGLQMVASQWGASTVQLRRKLTKKELEEKVMVASLACF